MVECDAFAALKKFRGKVCAIRSRSLPESARLCLAHCPVIICSIFRIEPMSLSKLPVSKALIATTALIAMLVVAGTAEAARKKQRGVRAAPASSVAAMIANAPHASRLEGGRVCYSEHAHHGSGTGNTRQAAERSAIGSWAGFTDFEYGSAWANFSKAAGKRMSCSQSGSGWDCSLEARPCR